MNEPTHISNPLQKLKDDLARKGFGMTLDEAHAQQICIHCKNPIKDRLINEVSRKEYEMSGLCDRCFDEITKI